MRNQVDTESSAKPHCSQVWITRFIIPIKRLFIVAFLLSVTIPLFCFNISGHYLWVRQGGNKIYLGKPRLGWLGLGKHE